jgi:hypothetical protein
VGLRTGIDEVEKTKFLTLLRPELRSLGHLAQSQSLHLLSYSDHFEDILKLMLSFFRKYIIATNSFHIQLYEGSCIVIMCTVHSITPL